MRVFERRSGFTMIELVIVVVILGVLAAVAVPKFIDLRSDAEIATCKANQHALEAAASLAFAQNTIAGSPSFPPNLAALNALFPGGSVPTCPSGGTYTYSSTDGSVSCDQTGHER